MECLFSTLRERLREREREMEGKGERASTRERETMMKIPISNGES